MVRQPLPHRLSFADTSLFADGHLLASPCALLPDVDTAVVLVAGTGTVGSGEFRPLRPSRSQLIL